MPKRKIHVNNDEKNEKKKKTISSSNCPLVCSQRNVDTDMPNCTSRPGYLIPIQPMRRPKQAHLVESPYPDQSRNKFQAKQLEVYGWQGLNGKSLRRRRAYTCFVLGSWRACLLNPDDYINSAVGSRMLPNFVQIGHLERIGCMTVGCKPFVDPVRLSFVGVCDKLLSLEDDNDGATDKMRNAASNEHGSHLFSRILPTTPILNTVDLQCYA